MFKACSDRKVEISRSPEEFVSKAGMDESLKTVCIFCIFELCR